MKAMILAAGLGTRLRPLTLKTPKPLVLINGKALIEYHIENLSKAGFTDIVINHAWLGEQIEVALGDGAKWGVNIIYSSEGEPLETGGGIYRVLSKLSNAGEAFVVVNGDILTDFDFSSLRGLEPDVAHLILVDNPEHNPEGDFSCMPDGLVDMQGDKYTFSGISVLTPKLFAGCVENAFPLGRLLKSAIVKREVSGAVYDGSWIDVGTHERLEQAENYIKENT
ncbi:N-acetylmuramate alpha-1-phosphate uridylyltransferase MurU [Neptunomonas sp.]|uniref:N-acetylmuramate alpha-1-phosphate uridylyltransferase MurU n=1 Tax=Neptunomonas sp. TaxID=1971898 RepID=UPI0025D5428D|nr:nucleotidyltransferase family protein [Neptunomonas sp.]